MRRILFAAILMPGPGRLRRRGGEEGRRPAGGRPGNQAAAQPPPLPHADRKDDPTVLVPGDPPLTQGTLDHNLDFWEWVLDLNLTDPQRAQWQRGWTDAFRKKKDNAKAQTLTAVRGNVEFWDAMAKLSTPSATSCASRSSPGNWPPCANPPRRNTSSWWAFTRRPTSPAGNATPSSSPAIRR